MLLSRIALSLALQNHFPVFRIRWTLLVLALASFSFPTFAAVDCPAFGQPLVNRYTFDVIDGGEDNEVLPDANAVQDGTVSNVTPQIAGKISGAIETDGNSTLSLGDYDPESSNGITISVWINPSEILDASILSKTSGSVVRDHYLMLGTTSGGALQFHLRTRRTTATINTTTGILNVGDWSFITVTYDKSNMKIYHNGVLVAQKAKKGSVATDSTVPFAIANQPPGAGDRAFTGIIDDLRMYNGALDASEIQALWVHDPENCDNPNPDTESPSIPTNFEVSSYAYTSVSLTWDASTDDDPTGVSGYLLTRNDTELPLVTGTVFQDTNLSPDTEYVYTLRATDQAGNESDSATVTASTDSVGSDTVAPSVPGNLSTSGITVSSVSLNWSASTDTGGSGVTHYTVSRDGIEIAQLPGADTTSYSDTDVVADTVYDYSVIATDLAGNSSAAVTLRVETPEVTDNEPPSTPENFSAADVTETYITLSWSESTDMGGSGVASYSISRDGNVIATVPGTSNTAYTDTTVSVNQSYSYSLSAIDTAGNSSTPATLIIATPLQWHVDKILTNLQVSTSQFNAQQTPIDASGGYVYTANVEHGPTGDTDGVNLLTVVRKGVMNGAGVWSWSNTTIENRTAYDKWHTAPSISVDKAGYIHVAYNMHNLPWQYKVSTDPHNINGFEFRGQAITLEEIKRYKFDNQTSFPTLGKADIPGNQITYPAFYKDNDGELYVTYRFAARPARSFADRTFSAGIAKYDVSQKTWSAIGEDVSIKRRDYASDPDAPSSIKAFASLKRWTTYHPRLEFGPQNQIHVDWYWREGIAGAELSRPCHLISDVQQKNFHDITGNSVVLPANPVGCGSLGFPDSLEFYTMGDTAIDSIGNSYVVVSPINTARQLVSFDQMTQEWVAENTPNNAPEIFFDHLDNLWAVSDGITLQVRLKDSNEWTHVYTDQGSNCFPRVIINDDASTAYIHAQKCTGENISIYSLQLK